MNLNTSINNNPPIPTSDTSSDPNQKINFLETDSSVPSIDDSFSDQLKISFRLNPPPLSPIPVTPILESTHSDPSNTLTPNSPIIITQPPPTSILDPAIIDPFLSSRIDQTLAHHTPLPVSIRTGRRLSHADNFALNTSPIPLLKHLHIPALEPSTGSAQKDSSSEKVL